MSTTNRLLDAKESAALAPEVVEKLEALGYVNADE
jgi:hypothetical protein